MAEENFGGLDDPQFDLEEGGNQPAPPKKSTFNRKWLIRGVVAVVCLTAAILMFNRFNTQNTPKKSSKNKSDITSSELSKEQKEQDEKKQQEEEKKKKKKIKYQIIFSLLEPSPFSKIVKELSMANIPFQTQQTGNKYSVLVDEDRLDEARNLLAIKGLPGPKNRGYELLDESQTLGVTEFDKRIRFLRALSGELEVAISQFNMIESAKVQIVLPEQRLFSVSQPPVTAAVLIKKFPGAKLNDDVVFSIIQLVANAVENLQLQNVSVIDTEGVVLSESIMERINIRKNALSASVNPEFSSQNVTEIQPSTSVTTGPNPIVPDYDQMVEWFDIKKKYEEILSQKASKQVLGILPIGTFKLAVNADLGSVENGEVVDVRRISVSIVVDNLNDDIYLDEETKKRIFTAIAGAVGYVKGRDTITLSKADFTILTEEERQQLSDLRQKEIRKKWMIVAGISVSGILISLFVLFKFFNFIKGSIKNKLSSKKIKEIEPEDNNFQEIQNEISNEKKFEQVRGLLDQNPQAMKRLIENWLTQG